MIDLIIPIFNEGEQIVKFLKKIKSENISNKNIFLCYDNELDNIFVHKDSIAELNN